MRLVPVKDHSHLLLIMDLRLLIAETRWGKELTKQDREFIKELTTFQVLSSSYLIPKTLRVQTATYLPRR